MTGKEVFTKINENYNLIEKLMDPTKFVLNETINKLMRENKELAAQCPHEYGEDGFCIYCKSKKEN